MRWGITADDSAGAALPRTAAGRLALNLAELTAADVEAGALIALVRHPMARFGLAASTVGRGAAAIDLALLRGRRIATSVQGLKDALAEAAGESREHATRPRAGLGAEDFAAAAAVLDAMSAALEPMLSARSGGLGPLARFAQAHATALDAVTRQADGSSGLAGPGAEELIALFADLAECGIEGPVLGIADYPKMLRSLMEGRSVTSPSPGHRRVKIWGLLEARLLEADMVVLGGLAEGVWPAAIPTDPFINRGMRAQLGLGPPERRIGQMAHDFVAACGAPRCILTRPLKAQGADTIPSRFLQRLSAVAGKASFAEAKLRGERYLRLAALLDDPGPLTPVARPSPLVPAKLQPRRLSVTAIETLLRDPYAIFARHVLKLDRLDPVGLPFDARLQGTVWHGALSSFVEAWPSALPEKAADELLRIGREWLAPFMDDPEVASFVWARFRRAALWYVEWERRRRRNIQRIAVETRSELEIPLEDGGAFRLTARPDRVERLKDGTLAIVDYKTGSPPGHADVLSGFSPQLTLEAAILAAGGMAEIPAAVVSELCHVALSGGNPPGKEQPVKPKGAEATLGDIASAHLAGLRQVLGDYRQGRRGFTSKPFPSRMPAFSDYDHLARFAEWADESEEEAEAQ
jgi:ATP-dependent helicase/nuclease subunit B